MGRRVGVVVKRRRPNAKLPWKGLGHGECEDFSRTKVLPQHTGSARKIGEAAVELLRGLGFSPYELRGLSVKVEDLRRPWREREWAKGGALARHFQKMERIKGQGGDLENVGEHGRESDSDGSKRHDSCMEVEEIGWPSSSRAGSEGL